MDIVKDKNSYVSTFVVCTILFLISPLIIHAQTTNTDNNTQDTNQTALLTFSIEDTLVLVGDTLTLHLNVENIIDLAGWQTDISFDPNVLEAVEVVGGDFLDVEDLKAFFQPGTIDNVTGQITSISAARLLEGGTSGRGRLLSITFMAKAIGEAQVTLTNLHAGTSGVSETIPLNIPVIDITVEDQPTPIESEPNISFSIDESSILVGDTITLNLDAENVIDLARWQCDIVFDPNILEVVEVVEGDLLKQGDAATLFSKSTINNTEGEITGLDTVRLNPDGVSGAGRLLSVNFVAKMVGVAQVTTTNLYAGTSKSVEITLNMPDIVITVSDVGSTRLSFSLDEIPVRVDDTFTLHLNIEDVTDLSGWLCDIVFDPAAMEAVEVVEGDFLKSGDTSTFFLKNTIDNGTGKITGLGAVRLSKNGASDKGKLFSVTFMAKTIGEAQVTIANFYAGSSNLTPIPMHLPEFLITIEERVFLPWDINEDGLVNILDLMHVAQYLNEDVSVSPRSDVNGDGTIGILDLIAIAQHISDSTPSAPGEFANRSGHFTDTVADNKKLMAVTIRTWITIAQTENDGSIAFQNGIANLQDLLTSLVPDKTKLLHNYPNPFNPETWIPYQLLNPANVIMSIYDVNGNNVRNFILGYQAAGVYKSHSRAVYWDGRNNMGEPVASGIYFYTLTAGNFTATRKMLIKR